MNNQPIGPEKPIQRGRFMDFVPRRPAAPKPRPEVIIPEPEDEYFEEEEAVAFDEPTPIFVNFARRAKKAVPKPPKRLPRPAPIPVQASTTMVRRQTTVVTPVAAPAPVRRPVAPAPRPATPGTRPATPAARPMMRPTPQQRPLGQPLPRPAKQPTYDMLEDFEEFEDLFTEPTPVKKQQPLNPQFINTDKVAKRPLSGTRLPSRPRPAKNTYARRGQAAELNDHVPTMVVSAPKKSSSLSLIIAIILTVIIGALVGAFVYLAFFQ